MKSPPDESDFRGSAHPGGAHRDAAPITPAAETRDPFAPDPRLQVIPEVLRESETSQPARADPGTSGSLLSAGRAWATAFDFIFTIGAGALLGWLLDRWQSTTPWGLLGGLALGFTTALMRIIRATLAEEKREAARRNAR